MQIAIVSTALAIVLFLCAYLGFRTGLRLGMKTAKGHITPRLEPVRAVKEDIVPHKADPVTAEMLKATQA